MSPRAAAEAHHAWAREPSVRVLIVEDHPLMRDAVARALRAEGHVCETARTIAAARQAMDDDPFDLVILDRGLPDGDGLDALRGWRAAGREAVVLVLTARSAVASRVDGLEAGADDYLVKPFEMAELVARVRALGRRVGSVREVVITVGDLELNTARAEVRRAGVLLPLRTKELAVLRALLERKGRVVSRDQLRRLCWGEQHEGSSNVEEATISALRRKLGTPPVIKTRRGLGYVIEG